MPRPKREPLTSAEHSELTEFVRANADHELEYVTGLFAALATAPSTIQPSEWLRALWEDPAFEDQEHAQHVLGLVFQHYNYIVATVRSETVRICPSPSQHDRVQEFCKGYRSGVQLDSAWLHDERGLAMVFVFAALAGDVAPDDLRSDPEIGDPDVWLEAHRQGLPAYVAALHDYWRERRRPPVVEAKVKVGRNDPCPCGSGRKYKKCCGGN